MSSLRLALKMSMIENPSTTGKPPKGSKEPKPDTFIEDPLLIMRKRKRKLSNADTKNSETSSKDSFDDRFDTKEIRPGNDDLDEEEKYPKTKVKRAKDSSDKQSNKKGRKSQSDSAVETTESDIQLDSKGDDTDMNSFSSYQAIEFENADKHELILVPKIKESSKISTILTTTSITADTIEPNNNTNNDIIEDDDVPPPPTFRSITDFAFNTEDNNNNDNNNPTDTIENIPSNTDNSYPNINHTTADINKQSHSENSHNDHLYNLSVSHVTHSYEKEPSRRSIVSSNRSDESNNDNDNVQQHDDDDDDDEINDNNTNTNNSPLVHQEDNEDDVNEDDEEDNEDEEDNDIREEDSDDNNDEVSDNIMHVSRNKYDNEIKINPDGSLVRKKGPGERRKKRKSNADCIDMMLLTQDNNNSGGGGNRYQSSRAAAALAKTKLALPKQGRNPYRHGGSFDYSLENTGNKSPAVNTPSGNRRGPKRRDNINNQYQKDDMTSPVSTTTTTAINEAQWVACDLCTKWRKIPSYVDQDNLPDQWYCSMNIWDALRNTCDAPEEETENSSESKEPPEYSEENVMNVPPESMPFSLTNLAHNQSSENLEFNVVDTITTTTNSNTIYKPRGRRSSSMDDVTYEPRPVGRPGRGRWGQRGRRPNSTRHINSGINNPYTYATMSAEDDNNDETGHVISGRSMYEQIDTNIDTNPNMATTTTTTTNNTYNNNIPGATGVRKRGGGRWGHRHLAMNTSVVEALNWVQCNKCKKWRVLGSGMKLEDLPEIWICSYNTWNIAYARCSAPLEPDPTTTTTTTTTTNSNTANNSNKSNMEGITSISGSKKVTQWVQCERKNCKKWRKIPSYVDVSQFPEKWYCEMNRWDPDRATCDSLEESDSDNEQNKQHISARNQLILANAKGPSSLSYRRIIFGTDGRIRPAYSEKNKTSQGLFSYVETQTNRSTTNTTTTTTEVDDYTEPNRRIAYWNSSHFNYIKSIHPAESSMSVMTSSTSITDLANSSTTTTTTTMNTTTSNDINTTLASLSHNNTTMNSYEIKKEPTYMLDAINRLYKRQLVEESDKNISESTDHTTVALSGTNINMTTSNHTHDIKSNKYTKNMTKHCIPIKLLYKLENEHQSLVSQLPLYERMRLEAIIIRSCLSACNGYIPPSTGVTYSTLISMLHASVFPDIQMEAVKSQLVDDNIRATINRLEMNGELEVSLTSSGELVMTGILYLKPTKKELYKIQIQQYVEKNNNNNVTNPAWIKKSGLPLKLRKMII